MEVARGYKFFVGCGVVNMMGEDINRGYVDAGIYGICVLGANVAQGRAEEGVQRR